jgi:hypothetical protein
VAINVRYRGLAEDVNDDIVFRGCG